MFNHLRTHCVFCYCCCCWSIFSFALAQCQFTEFCLTNGKLKAKKVHKGNCVSIGDDMVKWWCQKMTEWNHCNVTNKASQKQCEKSPTEINWMGSFRFFPSVELFVCPYYLLDRRKFVIWHQEHTLTLTYVNHSK